MKSTFDTQLDQLHIDITFKANQDLSRIKHLVKANLYTNAMISYHGINHLNLDSSLDYKVKMRIYDDIMKSYNTAKDKCKMHENLYNYYLTLKK